MENGSEQYTQPASYNFASVAEQLGALNNPDVLMARRHSLSGVFDSDPAYQNSILGVIHMYDYHRAFLSDNPLEDFDDDQLRGIAFCIADIHYQTGHYAYCLGELKFIEQTLVMSDDESLKTYISNATLDIYGLIGPDEPTDPAQARTEILLS